jgi:hypothetical protein
MFHRAGRIIFFLLAWAALPAAGARAQTPMAKPDLTKLADEAQVWLGDLVRINSVNPPGNEAEVAKYIAAIFQREGISYEVLEMAPGRNIVVARLQAGPLPDPSNALLLVAHQDTVGVDVKKWTADPFAASIRDGYMYGRAAAPGSPVTFHSSRRMMKNRAAPPASRWPSRNTGTRSHAPTPLMKAGA